MRKAAAVLVIAALALAACGKSGESAAVTVNDVSVTDKDVVAEMNAIGANTDFVKEEEAQGGKITGATPGSFDPNFAAGILVSQITSELVRQEVARRNVQITDECRAKSREDTLTNIGNGNATDGEAILNKFPVAYQESILERQTQVDALQGDLAHQPCGTGASAEEYYANHPDEFSQTCLSAIVIDDPDLAADVTNRARAGEDFAALARQYSTDGSKDVGGDIGCALPGQLPPELASVVQDADTGEVTEPTSTTDFGQVVLKVGAKRLAPFDDVATQAEELADQELGTAFNTWLEEARRQARIDVDSRYGTFDQEAFKITPPGDTAVTPPPTTAPAP